MSKEAALAFLQKAAQDEALQKKIVEFASGLGYEFTVDELSDLELDEATGGAAFVKYGGNVLRELKSDTIAPDLKTFKF